MKYDPIMCMMVDDSVKTEDSSYSDFKEVYNILAEALRNSTNTDKMVQLVSKAQGKILELAAKTKDSKTVDHAIRSCDEDKDRYEVVKIGEFLYGIYDNIKKKVVIESTKTGIESYSKMFNAKNLNNPRKI